MPRGNAGMKAPAHAWSLLVRFAQVLARWI